VEVFKEGWTSAEDACMEVKEQIDHSTSNNNNKIKSVLMKFCLRFELIIEK
jgi:hypothetical protein